MLDVQSDEDVRKIKIAKVGINKVLYPITFEENNGLEIKHCSTVGEFAFFVELPAEKKGTHMSRFLSVLYDFSPFFSFEKFNLLSQTINERLESHTCYFNVKFKYFFDMYAPVTKTKGTAHADVKLSLKNKNNTISKKLSIKVPVKTLCPCSKAISENGAHSQRSVVHLKIWDPQHSMKDYIQICELSSSAPLYPILKREDEKFITEKAYHT
ncbi:MAG: GTP cyclohydrolase, FolE2/MptA family, partial [Silvanigrellaceae bacterium]|nr:GTP cyclohydrolase, FolE2/MptA family [Silvanigrellaceae bacterium]